MGRTLTEAEAAHWCCPCLYCLARRQVGDWPSFRGPRLPASASDLPRRTQMLVLVAHNGKTLELDVQPGTRSVLTEPFRRKMQASPVSIALHGEVPLSFLVPLRKRAVLRPRCPVTATPVDVDPTKIDTQSGS